MTIKQDIVTYKLEIALPSGRTFTITSSDLDALHELEQLVKLGQEQHAKLNPEQKP